MGKLAEKLQRRWSCITEWYLALLNLAHTCEGVTEAALKKRLHQTHPDLETPGTPRACPLCECGVADQAVLEEHCRLAHGKAGKPGRIVKTMEFASAAELEMG
ncbi:hypothetical protein Aduo_018535 [Ancylostoma duodenale]